MTSTHSADAESRRSLELESALEQIRGVRSARVIFADDDLVSEIHLVGDSDRRPKQIVRDTESLLLARFGIRVDYRRISLVQLSEQERAAQERLQLVSSAVAPGSDSDVHVVLATSAGEYTGHAVPEPPPDEPSHARAAAVATLDAVCQAVGHDLPFVVSEVHLVTSEEGQQVCLVVITVAGDASQRLTGSSLVTKGVPTASSKATLDAINRRLSAWLGG